MNITFGLLDSGGSGGATEIEYVVLNENLPAHNTNYVEIASTEEKIFYIKRNDTLPNLVVCLKNESGVPIDLSIGGPAITFTMKNIDTGALLIDSATCSILIPSTGVIRYNWGLGETAVSGEYVGEFELVYSNGKITLPTIDTFTIVILEDLNSL